MCRCYISTCVSHMIKATVDKLHQCEADVARKKFALVLFTALQRCHDLRTATQLYAQVYVVFNSAHKSQQVMDSSAQLQDIVHRDIVLHYVKISTCMLRDTLDECYSTIPSWRVTNRLSHTCRKLNFFCVKMCRFHNY